MNDDLIRRSDAIEAITYSHLDNLTREERIAHIKAIPSADRQGWVDKAISIIDDMQRDGIIDYEQAWEFRMRARMKGACDETN